MSLRNLVNANIQAEELDSEDRCELREGEDRCPNRATRIVKEPYTPAGFQQFVCHDCAKSQIEFGYIDGGLIAPEESL